MKANVFCVTSFLCLAIILATLPTGIAAPVDSVESTRASAEIQKIDAFLSEQAVAQQLAALGVTPEQVQARLARLSDAQLAAVAAQIDLLQAGGTIQGGNPHPWGVMECIFRPIGRFFHDLYQLIFCWGPITTE